MVRSRGCCPAPAAAAAQRPGGCRPDPGSSRDSSRLEAGQQPLEGRTAAAWRKRLLACGLTDAATRLQHALCLYLLHTSRFHVAASALPGSDRFTTLGSRAAPGTPCGKRSVGTRRAASIKGLWRGAGERFFLGSGQSQLLKQITTTASFFRPPMAASAIFDLLRPSTRNSRGYTQLNGQTPSGSHTAAHRLAQASIAAQASPKRSASMA